MLQNIVSTDIAGVSCSVVSSPSLYLGMHIMQLGAKNPYQVEGGDIVFGAWSNERYLAQQEGKICFPS